MDAMSAGEAAPGTRADRRLRAALPMGHKCGIFAAFGHPDAVAATWFGLLALQHRGQESAGIAVGDGVTVHVRRGMGLIAEALHEGDLQALSAARPVAAIGHVRYSTTGKSELENAQPLRFQYRQGTVAVAHNGNFTNALMLRFECEAQGSIFKTGTDTEIVPHLMARSAEATMRGALLDALAQARGAYALGVLGPDRLWLCRDPDGIRPLTLGRVGDAWVAASETCALDAVGARVVRDVRPGEVVELSADGVETVALRPAGESHLCLFEYVYLARPDSDLQGRNVHLVRKEMGRRLARQAPVAADVVIGVPDSGISAAVGYAEETGIAYELGLIKNRYVGRTFIQPTQALREAAVRNKLNAVSAVLSGKRVVLVEDSVVRGTTARFLVGLVRHAGASEVHLRVASPPFLNPCYYGIDIPSRRDLLAPGRSPEQMAALVGAESLAFLDEAAAVGAAGGGGFCTACFSGVYPVPPVDRVPEPALHTGD